MVSSIKIKSNKHPVDDVSGDNHRNFTGFEPVRKSHGANIGFRG